MQALIRLKEGSIQLLGGEPGGLDRVHKLVSTWAGWHRNPAAVALPDGGRCSLYSARRWASTIVPLLQQQTLDLTWEEGSEQALRSEMGSLTRALLELDPPPSHSPTALRWADEWARQPMAHQAQAVRSLRWMGYRAILGDDMGLGKTATAIWAWQQSGAPRLLVVCPATVKFNWRKELWATLKDCNAHLIDGTPKQRADTFSAVQHVMEMGVGIKIGHGHQDLQRSAVIINYDLLHRLPDREAEILARWVQGQFLILDESHYIKNRKALRTKFTFNHLASARKGAVARLCLSGTPIRNTSEDLWAQIQVVRPGVWASFHQFDKMHLARSKMQIEYEKGGKTRKKTLTPVRKTMNREQLNAVVNTLQIRRKKEDVLNLPPKIHTYPELELDAPTMKIYRAMKEFALMELADLGGDTPIFHPAAKSALEATLRLEQIAQGFLGGIPEPYLEKVTPLIAKTAEKIEGRPGHLLFPSSTKVQWLSETIDTILLQGGQPVVFSRFNTPLFWLEKQWEDTCVLHGSLSAGERSDMIDAFQDGQKRIMFCQVKIAEGFNLTKSQDVIFYGRDWSPAINSQAGDRCHRIGQTGTVNIQVPIVLGTFEAYLHKKLEAKERDAEQSLRSVTIGELRKAL